VERLGFKDGALPGEWHDGVGVAWPRTGPDRTWIPKP
jgi:hypothetical protein